MIRTISFTVAAHVDEAVFIARRWDANYVMLFARLEFSFHAGMFVKHTHIFVCVKSLRVYRIL